MPSRVPQRVHAIKITFNLSKVSKIGSRDLQKSVSGYFRYKILGVDEPIDLYNILRSKISRVVRKLFNFFTKFMSETAPKGLPLGVK